MALARAYVADPDLLVLDEATSAVDPATEVRLQRALEGLTRGRTTLTIAHRLSTAEAADEVLVFDAGVVVQRGPHAELVVAGRRLRAAVASWMAQSDDHRPLSAASRADRAERARVAVALVFALNGLVFASWVSRLPAVREALGLSTGRAGAAAAVRVGRVDPGAADQRTARRPASVRRRTVLGGTAVVAAGLLLVSAAWPAGRCR